MKQFIFLLIIFSFLLGFINNEEISAFDNMNISIMPRIIGGAPATILSFPHMATVRLSDITFCTASIVGHFDFIAPAQCFTHTQDVIWPYSQVSIRTGTTSPVERGKIYYIRKVSVHPGWTGTGNKVHDIAHIKVLNEIKYSISQQKVNLPMQDVRSNALSWVTGWGYTEPIPGPDAQISLQMKKVAMWTLNYTDCQQFLPEHVILQKEQLCAYQQRGFGCSRADAGASLTIPNEVIGIMSWLSSEDCAAAEPEIFVNIYMESDFLLPFLNVVV